MNVSTTKKTILPAAALLAVLLVSSQPSYAGNFRQNHPRRAEVLGRDRNINNRLNNDYGHLGGHYGQLEHQDQSIARQEQNDARMNGGYITKGEQNQLNREENHVNQEIRQDYTGGGNGGGWGGGNGHGWGGGGGVNPGGPMQGGGGVNPGGPMQGGGGSFAQNHPRRAQVLSGDRAINNELSSDYGHLGGNYGQLEHQDQSIARQEQRDARMNGGYITSGQQTQLDNREANLQNKINQDNTQ